MMPARTRKQAVRDGDEFGHNLVKKDKKKKKEAKKMKEKAAVGPYDAAEEKTPSATFGGRNRGVVTDPRFASVHTDPRFMRVPKRQSKIEIDSRFDRMFEDKSFGRFAAPIDKRGKTTKGKTENPLFHYYVHQKEPMLGEKGGHVEKLEMMDEQEEDGVSESESTRSSSDEDDDQETMNGEIAHYLMANYEDTPQVEEATHRLAAVNMDWDHVKAVDIYVVMASCLPKDGNILSVAIYPSDFGLECMESEASKGPYTLIHGKKEQNILRDVDKDEDEDYNGEKGKEKWRSYELNKLRYYYAVIDCDSSATAEYLYKKVDGNEFLETSNFFDLRFIPDSMEFTKPPRDITSKAPTSYTKPEFHTRALQNGNVEPTWEGEEPERKKILRRKYTAEQLEKLDIENFLASEDDESDDEESTEVLSNQIHKPKKEAKYLALLKSSDDSDAEEGDQDMEITFNTGLEDIAKRVLEKKANKSETVWEAYLRRRKEKRKARKKNAKYSSDGDDEESDSDYQEAPMDPDQPDDFFVNETTETDFKVDKGSKVLRHKKRPDDDNNEQEATQAELELLCAGSNRTDTVNKDDNEKPRKAKGNKGKKLLKEDKLPKEDYVDDPRFSALFNSHLFALDPTDAQFKRSATYARQMLQKQRHGGITKADENVPSEQVHPPDNERYQEPGGMQPGEDSTKKDKLKVAALVKSIKRKAGSLKMERNIRSKHFS